MPTVQFPSTYGNDNVACSELQSYRLWSIAAMSHIVLSALHRGA